MPKVQEQGNSLPSSLHYALTDSQCNKCGAQLEWNAEFNDINSPKYISQHCGQDYLITSKEVPYQYQDQQNFQQQRAEQQSGINRALDETRDSIRKSIDEARRDIPRYTQAANEYQEQVGVPTIQFKKKPWLLS